jgi:8-oxo-dGTP diphosphatase
VTLVAALVRRRSELLMVRQAGPGEEPFWSTPGGRVEDGELLTEALARELVEEAGLELVDPGRVAFVSSDSTGRPSRCGICAASWSRAHCGSSGAIRTEAASSYLP